jgi:hypothetical protein
VVREAEHYPGVPKRDLDPDGRRFAVFASPEMATLEKTWVHMTFLASFFDELRRPIPAAGK